MSRKREATSDAPAAVATQDTRAGEMLEESEGLYRSMIELSPDSIVAVDAKGVILLCNTATCRLLGYSKDEIIGKHFSKVGIIRVRDMPKYLKLFSSVLRGKTLKSTEFTFYRKDGTCRLADVSTALLKLGDKTLVQIILRDITERKRMEQTLKQSEAKYRALVEEINDGFSTTDDKGIITFANQALAQIHGYSSPQELIGHPFMEFLPPEVRDEMAKAFSDSLKSKTPPQSVECPLIRKDGSKGFIELRPAPMVEDNKIVGTREVIRDVTERKRMEKEIQDKNEQLDSQNEELRAANEELRATEEELRIANEELQAANEELRETQEQLIRSEKLAAIGQLASGVGHELRNPLGAIKNAAYYIRGKMTKSELAKKQPRVMEFLDIMDDEITTSNKIINDLLNFARTGKPAVSAARIESLIDNTLAHLTIPENVTVTKKLEADLPEVEIDPDQIRQVLVNLITNAVQAMPEGGRLTISAQARNESLEVKVTDTGSGIPKEVASKIFDPLFTTKAKGIGLGLAVTKSIIENHKGSIGVNSKVGRGTTFTIELPINIVNTDGG